MPDEANPVPGPETPLSRIPLSERQEGSLRALCNWMQIAAVFTVVGAALTLVSAFTPRFDPGKIINAVISLLIGLWIYQAGTAFRRVAATDTADQRHLMEGFRLLRSVFLLQSILVIVVLALLVIALVVVGVVLVARG